MGVDDLGGGGAQKFQQVNNLSASGIMMSSQLRNEDKRGAKRNYHHASYPDLVVVFLRGLLCWICGAFLAVAQTSHACARPIQIAVSHAWASAPGILDIRRA
jgi:hypothetical protein